MDLSIVLRSTSWEEEQEARQIRDADAQHAVWKRLVDLACSIVGHQPRQYVFGDKEWTSCRTCAKHLRGPRPDFVESLGAIYSEIDWFAYWSRTSPFWAEIQ